MNPFCSFEKFCAYVAAMLKLRRFYEKLSTPCP
jgi:hypothetical protein